MSKINNTVTKEEFIKYYIEENHTVVETQRHFHIGGYKFYSYKKQWDAYRNEDQLTHMKKKTAVKKYSTRHQKNYNFSKDDFFKYYCLENHSQIETLLFFNISSSKFYKLLKYWNIKKSKKQKLEAQLTQAKRTNQLKFGCDWPTQNNRTIIKQHQTKLEKYGDAHYNNSRKNLETNLKNHNGMLFRNVDKIIETKRTQKTFNTSSVEKTFITQLRDLFNETDIIQQYRDERYANPKNGRCWCCDFYIKSRDLFIELNFYAAHGEHPFDKDNADDIKTLDEWEKRKKYYSSKTTGKLRKNCYWGFINTWTVVDPLKASIAVKNNLNYVVLYNQQQITDFLKNSAKQ